MYYQHFGLHRAPFSLEPDPDFLWLGEMHQEGLAALRYGILENKGFLLLTGDAGTGKTVLIQRLLRLLTEDVSVATVPDPRLSPLDFFTIVCHEFKMAPGIDGKADFLVKFKSFVRKEYSSNRRLLIVVDEAQRLTHELLDEVRVLSNIDYDNRKLVNIFFVGQIEFNRILDEPRHRALRQRITVSHHLVPLKPEETVAYIRHRLKVAGTEKGLFLPEAVREIFRFSQGIPRLINILCDRALITAYTRELDRVSPTMIQECAHELDMAPAAAAADEMSAPQPEPPAAVEATSAPAGPHPRASRASRGWIAAALALLVFAVFSFRAPEDKRAPEPAAVEKPAVVAQGSLKTDHKEMAPAKNETEPAGPKGRNPAETNAGQRPEKAGKPAVAPDKAVAAAQVPPPERIETVAIVEPASAAPTEPQAAAEPAPAEIKPPSAAEVSSGGTEKASKPAAVPDKAVAAAQVPPPERIETVAIAEPASTAPAEPQAAAEPTPAEKTSTRAAELTPGGLEPRGQPFLVFFKPNSAELEDASYETLRQVLEVMSAHPSAGVVLRVRPAEDARPELSSKLTELRAVSLKTALAAHPGFKGTLTVTYPEDGGPASVEFAKPGAEIRIAR